MLFSRKLRTITFEDAKRVLVTLLDDVGEGHWASQVSRSSPSSFRQLCGGMGSLNDLTICRENSHRIEDEATPRANTLLTSMIGICAETSRRGPMTGSEVAHVCVGEPTILSGSRCRQCGHSFTGSSQVLGFLALGRLRAQVMDGERSDWPTGPLLDFWRTEEPDSSIQTFVQRLQSCGINYQRGNGWMRPCHACGSDNTCVYRWHVSADSINPTDDNLSIGTGERGEAGNVDPG